MRKVITYGTFDTLHYGHISLLRRARALGDHLTVGLSSDAFNAIKNKKSYFDYQTRKSYLEAIRYVDAIISEDSWSQKADDIMAHNVSIFTMGADWEGNFDDLRQYCEVCYMSRTPEISSTIIKTSITARKHL